MEHNTVRKLVSAATLSLLVLTTTAGMAGLTMIICGRGLGSACD